MIDADVIVKKELTEELYLAKKAAKDQNRELTLTELVDFLISKYVIVKREEGAFVGGYITIDDISSSTFEEFDLSVSEREDIVDGLDTEFDYWLSEGHVEEVLHSEAEMYRENNPIYDDDEEEEEDDSDLDPDQDYD